MPYRSNFWTQISNGDLLAFFAAIIGVTLGRFVHWIDKEGRLPTLRELCYEPFMIFALGIATGGILQVCGITETLSVSGISAISGVYGVKAFDSLAAAICRKLGLKETMCQIQTKDKDDD